MSSIAPDPSPSATPGPFPQGVHVLRSPEGLATALTVLLSAIGGISLVLSGAGLYRSGLQDDLVSGPSAEASESLSGLDSLTIPLDFLHDVLYLATAVVFVVWFHRVRCNGQVFRPDGFTQSAGWAIGGWFIPFANLFFPYRTARQTWDASTQYAPDGTHRQVSGSPVVAWWLAFVVSAVLDRVASRQYIAALSHEALSDAAAFMAAAELSVAAAALLAVLFVRKLTAMQRVKAVQGPNAAV
ncbi:DUF4328 domain-containing protein [Streptomyces sp. TBY4]|uniref:DUF4328 domain-containing protein n=1 Tax=Streptomyces sp. TBY4 TaxID=2962030 RepID=UPI0020B7D32D|nr:DUF4328 domain-containing protein [Streptomyces sp. TBY4]MCP3753667.1 DUF4328 domain-containing protein [Streptomyces sp. TBY4]